MAASLNLIHELGQGKIAEHIHALTEKLIAGLRSLPVTLVTTFDRENRAGIVTFSVGGAEENIKLMNRLLQAEAEKTPTLTKQEALLTEIRDLLKSERK